MAMTIQHDIPWHQAAWQQLKQARAGQRLPHALLVTGPEGVGKGCFATSFSRLLFCQQPDWDNFRSCGQCPACIKSGHDAHPDFQYLAPQEGKREILVEDVRNLMRFIQISPQVEGGYKIVVIEPADAMNRSAANALLKTLEEPPDNRILILLSSTPGRIPATIRSRCQQLRLPQPTNEQAIDWLSRETGGAFEPLELERHDNAVFAALAAQQNAEQASPGAVEAEWQKQWLSATTGRESSLKVAQQWAELDEQKPLIRWLTRENARAMRAFLGAVPGETANIYAKAGLELDNALIIQSKISELTRIIDTTLNTRLLWETFLLDCQQMAQQAR